MRSAAEVAEVFRLDAAGANRCEISRLTGIPRSTICNWLDGKRSTKREPRTGLFMDRPAYSYVLGMYLGDGHIAHFARATVLRIYGDSKYPGIVSEIVRSIRALGVGAAGYRSASANMVIVASYSQFWPALLPQHGPGMKHTRHIELEDWQAEITHSYPQEFIRGLIHSDGCRFTNQIRHGEKRYTYPRYYFTNMSEDIKRLFCDHLDLLGIAWKKATHKNISIARREAVAALDSFVGPKY